MAKKKKEEKAEMMVRDVLHGLIIDAPKGYFIERDGKLSKRVYAINTKGCTLKKIER